MKDLLFASLPVSIFAALVLAAQSGVRPPGPPDPIRVLGIPAARDLRLLRETDMPYTVPAGHYFVLTGLGDSYNMQFELFLDGEPFIVRGYTSGLTLETLPPTRLDPGQILEARFGQVGQNALVTGYLERVR